VGLVGLLSATIVASLLMALALRDAVRSGDIARPKFLAGQSTGQGGSAPIFVAATPVLAPAPTLDLGEVQAWEGTDRVTVLVMGVDRRPGESTRTRTDSMMLLTIDPVAKTGGVLSIPRDLYVEVPGYGLDRVNSANVHGGGELAKQTVEYNLGVHVNYYAIVDFNAFVTLVDEIGGIDINVPKTIDDPQYPDQNYGYDPFHIEAGQQHLDGETALKYARTRHNDNDFDRSQRQQDVLMAIRAQVISFDMLPTLVAKAPVLIATLGDSVETDMPVDKMVGLALLARDVPRENIKSAVIDGNYITVYTTPQGAAVLIPEREKIGYLMADLFSLQ
jgi:LCP family protein required for cell wall assembly